ncbi:MAG: cysteine desulfurase [Candidatus Aenigmarchaeota archaeon]|nr:cysteine desulfurase [Candidatus Aenigmarchaeota archaeon]
MNDRIRSDFPILNKGMTYFDNAATSLTPEQVLEAMLDYYHNYKANVHRGIHELSQKASEKYEEAHKKVGKFVNVKPQEVIFVKNSTEAINLIALSMNWEKGDKIVSTSLDHHSNLVPWIRLKNKFGIDLKIVHPNEEGILNPEDYREHAEGAKLIVAPHVSNSIGTITDVKQIGKIAKEHGSLFLVDGAQSVPHMEVDAKDIDCDFMAISAHKMLGPTGVGALIMRNGLTEKIDPAIVGGGSILNVKLDSYTLTKPPENWEAGTPNIAGAIGFGAAVDYLQNIGMKKIENHEKELTKLALDLMENIKGVEIYGTKDIDKRVGVISFNVKGMNPHDVSSMFYEMNKIAVRSGHHCAMPAMENILKCPEGTVRASFYLYNTKEEIEKFEKTLKEISKIIL